MQAGKHYFTDKPPFTELSQLEEARRVAAETGKKYMVYYSERLHVECAVFAGELIHQGFSPPNCYTARESAPRGSRRHLLSMKRFRLILVVDAILKTAEVNPMEMSVRSVTE